MQEAIQKPYTSLDIPQRLFADHGQSVMSVGVGLGVGWHSQGKILFGSYVCSSFIPN